VLSIVEPPRLLIIEIADLGQCSLLRADQGGRAAQGLRKANGI